MLDGLRYVLRHPTLRGLAVSVLHVLVLGKRVPEVLGAQPQCRYVHLLREVTDAVTAKECQLAALVPPVMCQPGRIAVG